jgi:hypothetical protein
MESSIIIIIGSTALVAPQANVATVLFPGQPPTNFSVALCLSPPRQSILISVGHVLGYYQGLYTSF